MDKREYYTVSEAAALLQVSPSTIWRWIEADKLPAYRVGPKTIRVRRQDLEAIIRPARARRGEVIEVKETIQTSTQRAMKPLSEAEAAQGLVALQEARALAETIQARRQGERLGSSVEIIQQAREERSQQL